MTLFEMYVEYIKDENPHIGIMKIVWINVCRIIVSPLDCLSILVINKQKKAKYFLVIAVKMD